MGRQYTTTERAKIKQLLADGYTNESVGKLLGRTTMAIEAYAHKNRFPRGANGMRSLSAAAQEQAVDRVKRGEKRTVVAKSLGVSTSTLSNIPGMPKFRVTTARAGTRIVAAHFEDAPAVDETAKRLGVSSSAIVREALRRELNRLAGLREVPPLYGALV